MALVYAALCPHLVQSLFVRLIPYSHPGAYLKLFIFVFSQFRPVVIYV